MSIDRESLARDLASEFGSWDGWDTAKTCADTPNGNEPDDERAYWRGIVERVLGPAATDIPARWYSINRIGMATLCAGKDDARQQASVAERQWPHNGPHRAVQLIAVERTFGILNSQAIREMMNQSRMPLMPMTNNDPLHQAVATLCATSGASVPEFTEWLATGGLAKMAIRYFGNEPVDLSAAVSGSEPA